MTYTLNLKDCSSLKEEFTSISTKDDILSLDFRDLPPSTTIDKEVQKVVKAFAFMPVTVKELSLISVSDFDEESASVGVLFWNAAADLALFAAIPEHITSLNLHFTGMKDARSTDIAKAFRVLPSQVTSLQLSFDVDRHTGLEEIFQSIPQTVKNLELYKFSIDVFRFIHQAWSRLQYNILLVTDVWTRQPGLSV